MFLPIEHSNCCLGQLFLIAQERRKRDVFIRTTVIQEELLDWGEAGSKILWHSVLKLPILLAPVGHSPQKQPVNRFLLSSFCPVFDPHSTPNILPHKHHLNTQLA